jgi:adenine-specific DNA-methyltransferase
MARNKQGNAEKPAARGRVASIRHKDKRKNIPTEELRDFVAEEELKPKTMLYPRDPSLDPQLVWKGKDEQDQADLAVPVVPIYIQEKIHPQAIIDALPRMEKAGDDQPDLFADFNGLPADFDQRVDFYKHDGNWSNRMILGDSLLVMTSLAEKEGLKGKVQTIYIDPPYGIKFGSNWQVSTRKRDVKDGKAEDATRQPEQIRAFRDTWKLGVHSYLAYLRDRLTVARELLTETGSIFVQIGDENVHVVRCVMDETFGSQNGFTQITFTKTGGTTGRYLAGTSDYLLGYAKDIDQLKYRQLFKIKDVGGEGAEGYLSVQLPDGMRRKLSTDELAKPSLLPAGSKIFALDNLTSPRVREARTGYYPVKIDGREILPNKGEWKTHAEGMKRLVSVGRIQVVGDTPRYVRFIDDFPAFPIGNLWADTGVAGFASDKRYVVETASKLIERCLLMTTDPGDLVLDPTCGSGTTAYVAEQWGRRWITIDTSRVALALARTRLMGAKYPYYVLADSPEGMKKERELMSEPEALATGRAKTVANASGSDATPDIKKGFVYKRVPHVTLKSIANNQDIKEGMTRQQIDAAIAKHAETESLFDQPYEDNKRVRVCGPFSVESLSPHRTISAAEKKHQAEVGTKHGFKMRVIGPDNFGHMILDNLKKAGVQNTRKGERLQFDSLEVYPGEWIHGQGIYPGADGKPKRAAICIGPEHGTVGALLVKEAAKEAVKGVGFDVLVVCGFAFDPAVSEEAKRYGKLVVLPAKMNPDLAMGDELLKKTGAGNLFMVFGEPDVSIKKKNGQIVVEIKGLDV